MLQLCPSIVLSPLLSLFHLSLPLRYPLSPLRSPRSCTYSSILPLHSFHFLIHSLSCSLFFSLPSLPLSHHVTMSFYRALSLSFILIYLQLLPFSFRLPFSLSISISTSPSPKSCHCVPLLSCPSAFLSLFLQLFPFIGSLSLSFQPPFSKSCEYNIMSLHRALSLSLSLSLSLHTSL